MYGFVERLLARTLMAHLGEFVEGIRSEDINISIFTGGALDLRNLRIKPSALSQTLKLPFDLVHGSLGRLHISVPLTSLGKKPVVVEIEDLFVVGRSAEVRKLSPEDIEKASLEEKLGKLSLWERKFPIEEAFVEDAAGPSADSSKGSPSDDSWTSRILKAVLRNLQFSLRNVHIRLEDGQSDHENPISLGLGVDSLTVHNADQEWQDIPFIKESSQPEIRKLVSLKRLAVYMDRELWTSPRTDSEWCHLMREEMPSRPETDHSLVIQPIDAQVQVMVQKSMHVRGELPLVSVHVILGRLLADMHIWQYRGLLGMVDYMLGYGTAMAFQHIRPSVRPSQNPTAWWKYAAEVSRQGIRRSCGIPDLSLLQRRRHQRASGQEERAYINWYKDHVCREVCPWVKKCSREDDEVRQRLEKRISFSGLLRLRMMCREELRREKSQHESWVEEKKQASGGFFSRLFSRSSGSTNTEEQEPDWSASFSEEDRRLIEESVARAQDTMFSVEEWEDERLCHFHFSLCAENMTARMLGFRAAPMAEVIGMGYCLDIKMWQNVFEVENTLRSFEILDCVPNSAFPRVLYQPEDCKETASSDLLRVSVRRDKKSEVPFQIGIFLEPVRILYDVEFIQRTVAFFKPASKWIVRSMMEAAMHLVDRVRRQTWDKMSDFLVASKKLGVSLYLDIQSPLIISPVDYNDPDSQAVCFNLGHLVLCTENNVVARSEIIRDTLPPDEDSRYYDTYLVMLENISARVSPVTPTLEPLSDHFLIRPLSILGRMEHIVDADRVDLTRNRLFLEIPSLDLYVDHLGLQCALTTVATVAEIIDNPFGTIPTGTEIKAGFLDLYQESTKMWHKYFFLVHSPAQLWVYSSREALRCREAPLMLLDLGSGTELTELQSTMGNPVFRVQQPEGGVSNTLVLCAKSEEELQQWLDVLRRCIDGTQSPSVGDIAFPLPTTADGSPQPPPEQCASKSYWDRLSESASAYLTPAATGRPDASSSAAVGRRNGRAFQGTFTLRKLGLHVFANPSSGCGDAAEELVSVQLEHALLVLTFDPSELSLAWTLNQLELVNYIAAREFPILYDWRPQTVCAFGMGKGGKTRTPLTELSTAVGEGLTGGRGVHCERQEHCLEVMIRLHDTDSKGRTDGRYLHVAVDACIPLLELAIHPRSLFNLLYSLSGFLDQLRNYQPYRSSNGHGTSSSRPVSSEASGSRGASIQVPVFPDLDDPEDGGRCAQSSLCEDAGALKPWSMDIHIQGQVDADLWELYRLISHMEMSSFHISIDRHSNIDISFGEVFLYDCVEKTSSGENLLMVAPLWSHIQVPDVLRDSTTARNPCTRAESYPLQPTLAPEEPVPQTHLLQVSVKPKLVEISAHDVYCILIMSSVYRFWDAFSVFLDDLMQIFSTPTAEADEHDSGSIIVGQVHHACILAPRKVGSVEEQYIRLRRLDLHRKMHLSVPAGEDSLAVLAKKLDPSNAGVRVDRFRFHAQLEDGFSRWEEHGDFSPLLTRLESVTTLDRILPGKHYPVENPQLLDTPLCYKTLVSIETLEACVTENQLMGLIACFNENLLAEHPLTYIPPGGPGPAGLDRPPPLPEHERPSSRFEMHAVQAQVRFCQGSSEVPLALAMVDQVYFQMDTLRGIQRLGHRFHWKIECTAHSMRMVDIRASSTTCSRFRHFIDCGAEGRGTQQFEFRYELGPESRNLYAVVQHMNFFSIPDFLVDIGNVITRFVSPQVFQDELSDKDRTDRRKALQRLGIDEHGFPLKTVPRLRRKPRAMEADWGAAESDAVSLAPAEVESGLESEVDVQTQRAMLGLTGVVGPRHFDDIDILESQSLPGDLFLHQHRRMMFHSPQQLVGSSGAEEEWQHIDVEGNGDFASLASVVRIHGQGHTLVFGTVQRNLPLIYVDKNLEVIFSNVVFRFVDMCRLEELISLGSGSSISLDPSCGVAYDVVPYEGLTMLGRHRLFLERHSRGITPLTSTVGSHDLQEVVPSSSGSGSQSGRGAFAPRVSSNASPANLVPPPPPLGSTISPTSVRSRSNSRHAGSGVANNPHPLLNRSARGTRSRNNSMLRVRASASPLPLLSTGEVDSPTSPLRPVFISRAEGSPEEGVDEGHERTKYLSKDSMGSFFLEDEVEQPASLSLPENGGSPLEVSFHLRSLLFRIPKDPSLDSSAAISCGLSGMGNVNFIRGEDGLYSLDAYLEAENICVRVDRPDCQVELEKLPHILHPMLASLKLSVKEIPSEEEGDDQPVKLRISPSVEVDQVSTRLAFKDAEVCVAVLQQVWRSSPRLALLQHWKESHQGNSLVQGPPQTLRSNLGRRLIQALRKPWFGHPDRIDTSAGIFELEEVYCAVQCGTIRMLIADNSGEQELPLLTFQLNHIRGEISKDPGSLWKGTLQTEVRADFLNARVAAWEPFVEPFIPVLSLVRGSSLELQRQADEEEYDTMMEAEEAQGLSRQHSGRGGTKAGSSSGSSLRHVTSSTTLAHGASQHDLLREVSNAKELVEDPLSNIVQVQCPEVVNINVTHVLLDNLSQVVSLMGKIMERVHDIHSFGDSQSYAPTEVLKPRHFALAVINQCHFDISLQHSSLLEWVSVPHGQWQGLELSMGTSEFQDENRLDILFPELRSRKCSLVVSSVGCHIVHIQDDVYAVVEISVSHGRKEVLIRSPFQLENCSEAEDLLVLMDCRRDPFLVSPGQTLSLPLGTNLRSSVALCMPGADDFTRSVSFEAAERYTHACGIMRGGKPLNMLTSLAKRRLPVLEEDVFMTDAPEGLEDVVGTDAPAPRKSSAGAAQSYRLLVFPPLVLENVLPFDLLVGLIQDEHTEDTRALFHGVIPPGQSVDVWVDPSSVVSMQCSFGVEGEEWSGGCIIFGTRHDTPEMVVTNLDSRMELSVFLDHQHDAPDREDLFHKVSLYTTDWIFNHTNQELLYSGVHFTQDKRTLEGRPGSQQLFSTLYRHNGDQGRQVDELCVRADSSPLQSEPIPHTLVGTSSKFFCHFPSGWDAPIMGFTCHSELGVGKFKRTRLVEIRSQFVISNQLDLSLEVTTDVPRVDIVASHSCFDLHWAAPFSAEAPPLFRLRLASLPGAEWSNPIPLLHPSEDFNVKCMVHTKMDASDELHPEWIILNICKLVHHGCTFLCVRPGACRPHYVIRNFCWSVVSVCQQGGHNIHLAPFSETPFCWEDLTVPEPLLGVYAMGAMRTISLDKTLNHIFVIGRGRDRTDALIYVHGSTKVLCLLPHEPQSSLREDLRFLLKGQQSSGLDPSSAGGGVLEDMLNFSIQVSMLGVSLVSSRPEEIIYASLLEFSCASNWTASHQSIDVSASSLQVDSQLKKSSFPVALRPASKGVDYSKPFLTFQSIKNLLDTTCDHFEKLMVGIQEMEVEMDEVLISSLIEFTNQMKDPLESEGTNSPGGSSLSQHLSQSLALVSHPNLEAMSPSRLYVKKLGISGIKLHFTSQGSQHTTKLSIWKNTVTQVLGNILLNIKRAPIRFKALELQEVHGTPMEDIKKFYLAQMGTQLVSIFPSMSIIGNPQGLFVDIATGVKDFFQEPYEAFVRSPASLPRSIASGFGSLIKNSVSAPLRSAGGVTAAIGDGFATLAMDSRFQERRRKRRNPSNTLTGVLTGLEGLGDGILSGMWGIFAQPVIGARSGGIGGFFKGIGKGLLGAISKPVAGAVDLVTGTTEGTRNMGEFLSRTKIRPVRIPRSFGRNGTLQCYDPISTLGTVFLKKLRGGRYKRDTYVAHLVSREGDHAFFVTDRRLLYVDIPHQSVLRDVPLSGIRVIKVDGPDHLSMYSRRRRGTMLSFDLRALDPEAVQVLVSCLLRVHKSMEAAREHRRQRLRYAEKMRRDKGRGAEEEGRESQSASDSDESDLLTEASVSSSMYDFGLTAARWH